MATVKILAIDPGDKHVGWAYDDGISIVSGEWDPTESTDRIVHMLTCDVVDEVVVEEFRLYDREYSNQTWSTLKTSQLIGAIKLICHWFRVPLIEQGAYIKKPTRKKLRVRGIEHQTESTHGRDAELHLYYRKLRSHA